MPLVTGKISWRANSSNKTYSGLLNAIRNFLVNSGNYTVISDQITASSYFVVQSTRDTGFVGDRIVARIGINTYIEQLWYAGPWQSNGIPFLYITPWESWSGTTGVNGQESGTSGNNFFNSEDNTTFSLVNDCDIWVSCDTTFILSMSREYVYSSTLTLGSRQSSHVPNGVACFERLSGDNDPGTFYGRVRKDSWSSGSYVFYVPKRFDGATGASAVFSFQTSISRLTTGNAWALTGPDESGKHSVFQLNISSPTLNRLKGNLFGLAVSTTGPDLAVGQLLPSSQNPQYIVGRSRETNTASAPTILMRVASTITPITT